MTLSPHDPACPDGINPSATVTLGDQGRLTPGQIHEIPARQGRAVRLAAGRTLRIINHHGQQVGDLWAFRDGDTTEFLSMEHMRPTLGRLSPRCGDALITNRRRPLLTFVEDSSPGVHDTLIAACDLRRYETLGHRGYHDNCTDNLRMAMAAIGERLPEVPCPFNLWMNTQPRPDGGIDWLPPVSRPGDVLRLRAQADTIVVLSCCPMDLSPINGTAMRPTSLQMLVEA